MDTKTALKEALQALEDSDKQLMRDAANKYLFAKRTNGDITGTYRYLHDVLRYIESKYHVTLFTPGVAPEKIIEAFANKYEAKTAAIVGERCYNCTFHSMEEANAWLATQRGLTITNIQVTTSRVGLDIQRIDISYKTASVNNLYQITEQMKHRFFAGSNHEKFRKKWEEQHPNYRYVFSLKKKWGFSLIGGRVGFFRYVKEKYIVLYTQKNVM